MTASVESYVRGCAARLVYSVIHRNRLVDAGELTLNPLADLISGHRCVRLHINKHPNTLYLGIFGIIVHSIAAIHGIIFLSVRHSGSNLIVLRDGVICGHSAKDQRQCQSGDTHLRAKVLANARKFF